jgi:hypothetical protein
MNENHFVALIWITGAFIAAQVPVIAEAGSRPASRNRQELISPLNREQLNTKVPNFYCFEYRGTPQPGKRYWLRVSNNMWIERYPDGFESRFRVLGHANVKDTEGTIVVKISGNESKTGTNNNGGLQDFVPDKGSDLMHHWYRNAGRGDDDWHDLGKMQSVE